MKRKVHVVPHSHWDREWYFTTSRSKVYLMKDLKDVLDTLESNPDFKYFMVDAQGSLLDDYIKWMPQDKDRITKLVKEKKLVIGPWYTQTDQLVISGESIVRNMYYGMKRCETFGGYMNVGYVPDSFGQSGNMPQIYKEFGIDDTLFWRGVSDDMVNHTDYNWRGDDGSVVFTTQIPFGYYIGGNIPDISRIGYGVSKSAVNNITQQIAMEYAKYNIRCNAVLPGMTATDAVSRSMDEQFQKSFLSHVPLNRMGTPEDIANAVFFFASENSSYITGSILEVSGGYHLGTPQYADYVGRKMQE